MEFSAQEIADILEGEIDGDPNVKVRKLSKIEEGEPASLTFLANPKYTEYIYTTRASVVIVNKDFQPDRELEGNATLIRVDDAYQSFAKVLEYYDSMKEERTGIEEPNHIDSSVTLGDNIYIGAFSYIGKNVDIGNNVKIYPGCYIGDECEIGDGTELHAGCKLYPHTRIGKDCSIHSSVTLGSDGFGFAPNDGDQFQKVSQTGNVVIEDHVEIGSNTTIDRATLGSTIIRKGVKLDNLIQIAHNVEIGENTVIAAQSGIAGSSKVGRNCMIGGQVGIIGHLTIADNVKIAAQSGIGNDITEEGAIVQGSPSFDIGDYKKSYVVFRQLPDLKKKINELEKHLEELKRST